MKNLTLLTLIALCSCFREPFCNEHDSDEMIGVTKILDEQYIAYLKSDGDMGRNGIKISTQSEYQRLFSYCCGDTLEEIDFTKFDILGLTTINDGRNSTYLLEVETDDFKKKVTYSVTERFCKKSSPFDGRSNLVVVPKIPANYTVSYLRK